MAQPGIVNEETKAAWVAMQHKAFMRFCNTYLKRRNIVLKDLQTDFSDGVNLINFLEVISSKSVGKYTKEPKRLAQKMENLSLALKFLKNENLKLVGIGPEDIGNGNLKLILGMIWTIILRYQINLGDSDAEGKAKSELLKWVRRKIPEYNITNFTSSWQDGAPICALKEALLPGTIDVKGLPSDPLECATLGMNAAEKEMEIPQLLDPTDVVRGPDELAMMTYISYFRDWEAKMAEREAAERARREAEELARLRRTPTADQSKVLVPEGERAEVHIPYTFHIEARNMEGNLVGCGGHGGSFQVRVKSPASAGKFVVPDIATVKDQDSGVYAVTWTPLEPGPHELAVAYEGSPLQHTPVHVDVDPATPDPRFSEIQGPGVGDGGEVLAHHEVPFTIVARNRINEQLRSGGHHFDVAVKALDAGRELATNVIDNNNGTYSVTYTPIDRGTHEVAVGFRGTPLSNSPRSVFVDLSDADVDATQTFAEGPGLEANNKANDTAHYSTFAVHARNKHGQPVVPPAGAVDVVIIAPDESTLPAELTPAGDGTTVQVRYRPKVAGLHHVDVIVRNRSAPMFYEHVKGSPADVNVRLGSSPQHTVAYGPGVESGKPWDTLPANFTVEVRDADGNRRTEGGDDVAVAVTGPNGPVDVAGVVDNGDGTYSVAYNPTTPGPHTVDVKLNGEPIAKSPFHVAVRAGAHPKRSGIEKFTFTIRARTKEGEDKTSGGDEFVVEIVEVAVGRRVENVNVRDKNNGLYTVSYCLPPPVEGADPNAPREFAVNALLNGEHIVGSPWKMLL